MVVRCVEWFGNKFDVGNIYHTDAEGYIANGKGERTLKRAGEYLGKHDRNYEFENVSLTKTLLIPWKYVAETRDGKKALFTGGGFIDEHGLGCFNIHNYKEDLTWSLHEKGKDIVTIYEVGAVNSDSRSFDLSEIINKSVEVWSREEDSVRKEYEKVLAEIKELAITAEKLKNILRF